MKVSEEYVQRLLSGSDAIESIARLVQFWTPRARRSSSEERLGLTEPEFNVHMIVTYDGEVGNGGHSQFFLNPSGGRVREVLAALGAVGLGDLRQVLWEACSFFPGQSVPRDDEERTRLIEALPREVWASWENLDRRYYALNRNVNRSLLDYLRGHSDLVLVPERTPSA